LRLFKCFGIPRAAAYGSYGKDAYNSFKSVYTRGNADFCSSVLRADGICINQSDKVEKSHQVLLMSRIYSCGSNVVIWLGHADKERVYVALGLVCQLAAERVAQLSHLNPGHPPPHYLWYADKRNKYIKVVPEEARFDLKAQRDHLIFLAALFSAPWFERVWVIQEFVMSSSAQVFWGNASIRFDLLGEAAVYVGTEYAAFSNYSASIGLRNCWNMYHLKYVQGEQSFWEVFRALRDRKATDPRDQVYALLGLPITDRGADGWFPMRPDYTLSTADVFHTVARKLLVERQVIDVLISVAHGKQFREGWASWVPDWSDMRAGGVFRTMDVGSEPDPPSDINIPQACSVCITNCHDSISLKGFVVDVVQTLAEDFFADKKIITRAYKLRPKLTPKRKEWVAAISAYATTYQGIFDEDTLALTLTGGFHLEDDETTSSEVYNYLDDYRNFLQYAQNPTESYSERIINYFNLVINTIARRRFFITEKGSLGLGPAATEKGDVVAIFFGASVPFVLRPSGEERHWRLVGGCYVHDVVGREAVDGWREIGELATEFHLF
jgi:hypothetical protein